MSRIKTTFEAIQARGKKALIEAATAAGYSKEEVRKFVNELLKVPPKVSTKVTASTTLRIVDVAVSQGVRKPHRSDTVADILAAPDRDALLDWLRHRPLLAP